MKIIVLETRRDHYEVMGYFFYLKKRFPSIDLTIYAQDPDNSWLQFYSREIALAPIISLDSIKTEEKLKNIKAEVVFINSIDMSWDEANKETIDFVVTHIAKSRDINDLYLQLHMGNNANAAKFRGLNANFTSLFPNRDCKRLLMPYSIGENSRNLVTDKLNITFVGGINKVKRETVELLSKTFNISHFSPYDADKVDGVEYFIDVPARNLVNHLRTVTDYIVIDYPFLDRLSGVILQAISLEIPMIINKDYAEVIDIPSICYITFEEPIDIVTNINLVDKLFYYRLKCNIRQYKAKLLGQCDEYFINSSESKYQGLYEGKGDYYWRKSYFRNLWSSKISNELKFKLSKDLFSGKQAFIFAAGPSLSKVDMTKIKEKLGNSLVICIKQSVELVGNDCDSMMINFCNYTDYDWSKVECPVLWTTWNSSQPSLLREKGAPADSIFRVEDNGNPDGDTLPHTTAGKESWNNMLAFPDGIVPWGPGLMYELAIPMALHAGVTHIYLVGWDIGSLNKKSNEPFLNQHFYDEKQIQMKTKITSLEIETVASSTKSLNDWLSKQGIGLSVVSDRSLVDNCVKREVQWIQT